MIRRFALAFMLMALPVAAQAQSLSLMDKMKLNQACGADIKTVCGTVEPGDGRLAQCLKENADQLSEACVETLAYFRDKLNPTEPPAETATGD